MIEEFPPVTREWTVFWKWIPSSECQVQSCRFSSGFWKRIRRQRAKSLTRARLQVSRSSRCLEALVLADGSTQFYLPYASECACSRSIRSWRCQLKESNPLPWNWEANLPWSSSPTVIWRMLWRGRWWPTSSRKARYAPVPGRGFKGSSPLHPTACFKAFSFEIISDLQKRWIACNLEPCFPNVNVLSHFLCHSLFLSIHTYACYFFLKCLKVADMILWKLNVYYLWNFRAVSRSN